VSNGRYILDETGTPVPEPDLYKWGKWFESMGNRVLQQDMVGDVKVSTVFLGLDHNWGEGEPVLWETMVFGGKLDMEQDRYTSRDEAIKGHASILQRVKEAENDDH
jgi:hypothetical protein